MTDADDDELAEQLIKVQNKVEEAAWKDYGRAMYWLIATCLILMVSTGAFFYLLFIHGLLSSLPAALAVLVGWLVLVRLDARAKKARRTWQVAFDWGEKLTS